MGKPTMVSTTIKSSFSEVKVQGLFPRKTHYPFMEVDVTLGTQVS